MTLILKNVKLIRASDLIEEMSRQTGMYVTEAREMFLDVILDTEYHDDGSVDHIVELLPFSSEEVHDRYEGFYLDPHTMQCIEFINAWNGLLEELNLESLLVRIDMENLYEDE